MILRRLQAPRTVVNSFHSTACVRNDDAFQSKQKPPKKRSFLGLIDKGSKNAKLYDALKSLNASSSKSDRNSEDVFKILKKKVEPIKELNLPPELLESKQKQGVKLLEQLTQGFRNDLTDGVTSRDIAINRLRWWFDVLNDKVPFPFPEHLSFSQWRQLVSYKDIFAMTEYLLAVVEDTWYDEEVLKKIRELDNETTQPTLNILPEWYDDLIGDNDELQEKWDFICQVYEDMLMYGHSVVSNLSLNETKWALKLRAEEDEITEFMTHIHYKRTERLLEAVEQRIQLIDWIPSGASDSIVINEKAAFDEMFNRAQEKKYLSQMLSGCAQKFVLDLGADDLTSMRRLYTSQLPSAIQRNQFSMNPFELFLTGIDKDASFIQRRFEVGTKLLMETWTSKDTIDLFDKDRLLVISPDSENELEYNADDIYVIPMTHPTVNRPVAMSYAKKHNIRHAKLPLENTVGFVHRGLPLPAIVSVLHDYIWSRDWFFASRWVPPQLFVEVMKHNAITTFQEYVYLVHRYLHPTHIFCPKAMMTPSQYRTKYAKLMESAPRDGILKFSSKYHRQKLQVNPNFLQNYYKMLDK